MLLFITLSTPPSSEAGDVSTVLKPSETGTSIFAKAAPPSFALELTPAGRREEPAAPWASPPPSSPWRRGEGAPWASPSRPASCGPSPTPPSSAAALSLAPAPSPSPSAAAPSRGDPSPCLAPAAAPGGRTRAPAPVEAGAGGISRGSSAEAAAGGRDTHAVVVRERRLRVLDPEVFVMSSPPESLHLIVIVGVSVGVTVGRRGRGPRECRHVPPCLLRREALGLDLPVDGISEVHFTAGHKHKLGGNSCGGKSQSYLAHRDEHNQRPSAQRMHVR